MTKPNMYCAVTRVYCLYDADTMGLNKIEIEIEFNMYIRFMKIGQSVVPYMH